MMYIIDKIKKWRSRKVSTEEIIDKTARDYALEIFGQIYSLPLNINKNEVLQHVIHFMHPNKHLHANPTKKELIVSKDVMTTVGPSDYIPGAL